MRCVKAFLIIPFPLTDFVDTLSVFLHQAIVIKPFNNQDTEEYFYGIFKKYQRHKDIDMEFLH